MAVGVSFVPTCQFSSFHAVLGCIHCVVVSWNAHGIFEAMVAESKVDTFSFSWVIDVLLQFSL